ncbi:hypothetical protein [Novosphingobium taihuense]|uniref:Uncharacterized protein n=1 Tax=Novosphingobium taihuense TaxID=260085 RepID=A0A7W7A9A1_9SPHN|nr:hypothetical protein [Novosphingobium taihuense]MBB4612057.1 hypothetical protein [Novosphingobium taihuense]TWH88590.1 hypothetical protein IQ25_00713 [Novosphingobium taihuense]
MRAFFRNVSPRRAVVDFWQVFTAPSDYRRVGLLMAAAVTGTLFTAMAMEGGTALPRPPEIIYFPSFVENRSDAEILAENKVASAKARAEAAEEEARQERVRQMYKAVGDATGVETKRAYEEGKAEREAYRKKVEAARKEVLDKHMVDNPVFDAEMKKAQNGAQ